MKNSALPVDSAAYDVVGSYCQDKVNGFTNQILDRMLELVNPADAISVLDAMAGDGNLTLRLYDYCKLRGIPFPSVTVLEYSRVQYEFAKAYLARVPVKVLRGNVVTMDSIETGKPIADCSFDRVMIKSGNHEIPQERQLQMYESIFRILRPGGLFVNLGFLFNDRQERDELREIARVKDTLADMQGAVANRYFLTRDELYSMLKQAGYVGIRSGESFEYSIHSAVVAQQYFAVEKREEADMDFQVSQARAKVMRRNGRIRFEKDHSIMNCPGEITVARRPTLVETNILTFRKYPMDFLRNVKAHSQMLQEANRYIQVGAKVLDLGCGIGLMAERLASRDISYYGLDISQDFVRICRERYANQSNLRFDAADITADELGDNLYSVVTILNTLNLPGIDAVKVLRKTYRALRPDGYIIVSGPTSAKSFKRAEPLILAQLEQDGLVKGNEANIQALRESNARLLTDKGNYWSVEGMVALLKGLGYREIVATNTELYYGFAYMVVAKK